MMMHVIPQTGSHEAAKRTPAVDKCRLRLLVLIFLLIPFISPFCAWSGGPRAPSTGTWIFSFENDTFFGTDYLYTNGVKVTWLSPDIDSSQEPRTALGSIHSTLASLSIDRQPDVALDVSLAFGQNMYTPEETQRTELIKTDRPYAGLSYLEMGLHGKSNRRVNSWALVLGVVGPHSQAEDTQRLIHEWKGENVSRGWRHQLKDEPVFNLFFAQKHKILHEKSDGGWGCDTIPLWGAGLGNLFIGANIGTQIRFGWNLPKDFGTSMIGPGSSTNASVDKQGPCFSERFYKPGVHIFIGMDGSYVLRNLTLDGNTFQRSHSVEKEPFIGTFMAGVGFTIKRFKVSFAHVYRTNAFKGQKDQEEYGSISLSVIY